MYPVELTTPMQSELTDHGFEALSTQEAVTEVLEQKEGSVLVVINSVCGCAAANARPGAKMAVQNEKVPQKLTTVFAGVDKEAVNALSPIFSIYCFVQRWQTGAFFRTPSH